MSLRESFRAYSAAPLFVALFLPLVAGSIGGGVASVPDVRGVMDYAWLALAGFGIVLALIGRSRKRGKGPGRLELPGFSVLLLAILAVVLFRYGAPLLADHAWLWPYLQEARPVAYLLFAAAWALTAGVPRREAFVKAGGVLALAVCVDFGLRMWLPEAAFLSVDREVVAALLLVCLCAGFGMDEKEMPVLRGLLLAGIVATLSRPALFAAMWAWLFFGNGRWPSRLPYAALCLMALFATVVSPHPVLSGTLHYTDYWLWLEGLKLVLADPARMIAGFPLADPLPTRIPFGMVALWDGGGDLTAFDGVFIFQVEPMWLRTALAWGLGGPAALMLGLLALVAAARNRFAAGLATAVACTGLLVGLAHNPVTAVVVWLALFAAVRTGTDPKYDKQEE